VPEFKEISREEILKAVALYEEKKYNI